MAKTQQQWADYYGWALSLLKSDKSLWDLFQKATKGNWTAQKFVSELKKTSWYQKNSEQARKTLALKHTDPEEWRNRVRTIFQEIQGLAGQMGVRNVNWQVYWDMAEDALMFGWSNSKLRQELAKHLTSKGGGTYGGDAENARQQLEQYAFSMGIKLDSGVMHGWLKGIISGTRTLEDYKGWIMKQAMSAFPALADQIKGGLSVRDIADPYMSAMGRILEINQEQLTLDDPLVRGALSKAGQDGKAALMPLWEFENQLRQDPRWLQTNNARQSLNSTARSIGQMFGMSI